LPSIEKTLLLASYLASNNPQETDSTTFGNALKGRRKRQRAGQDPDQEPAQPQSKENLVSPRTFGLERLLAIYTQILPSISIPVLSSLWWHPSAAVRQQREESEISENGDSEKKMRMSMLNNPTIFEIEQKLLYYGHSETHIFSAVSLSNFSRPPLMVSQINSLVQKQHLLVRATGSAAKNQFYDSTTSVIYYCTLNLEHAEELARSLSFPLRDYLCT
jgi:hypothetical protein